MSRAEREHKEQQRQLEQLQHSQEESRRVEEQLRQALITMALDPNSREAKARVLFPYGAVLVYLDGKSLLFLGIAGSPPPLDIVWEKCRLSRRVDGELAFDMTVQLPKGPTIEMYSQPVAIADGTRTRLFHSTRSDVWIAIERVDGDKIAAMIGQAPHDAAGRGGIGIAEELLR